MLRNLGEIPLTRKYKWNENTIFVNSIPDFNYYD